MGKPPQLNKGRHGHFKARKPGAPGGAGPKKGKAAPAPVLGGVRALKKPVSKRKQKLAARRMAFDRKDAEAELAKLGISRDEIADIVMRDAAAPAPAAAAPAPGAAAGAGAAGKKTKASK